MVLDIIKVVIIPIILGLIFHKIFKEKIEKITKVLVIIPILTILLVMGVCVAPNRANLINSGIILILVVCLHQLVRIYYGIFSWKTYKNE